MAQPTSTCMKSRSDWYRAAPGDICLEPAKEAYESARAVFPSSKPGKNGLNDALASSKSINDVIRAVSDAQSLYKDKVESSSVRKWLSRFSRRVTFYSSIIDVFAQFHPEYCALAWGAMKFLFVLFENHEKKIQLLAKALTLIADALPRAELAATLYPTKQIQTAFAELYANIITFCLRAKAWYEAGSLKRAVLAFTHPVELEYKDIVADITACSQKIRLQAEASGQAEQRDVHLLLLEMAERQKASNVEIAKLQAQVQEFQRTNQNNYIQTMSCLQDVQISQIMDYVSTTSRFNEMTCLQVRLHARNRRRGVKSNQKAPPIWILPKVQNWNKNKTSCLLTLGTDRKSIQSVQHSCIDAIEYLRLREVPVIWILAPPQTTSIASNKLSSLEVLKSMVAQAARIYCRMNSNQHINLTNQQCRTAETEDDWITILGMILQSTPVVYIVIDLSVLDSSIGSLQRGFTWVSGFAGLFKKMADRGARTIVKVILTTTGALRAGEKQRESPSSHFQVSVGTDGRSLAAIRRNVPIRLMKGRRAGRNSKMDHFMLN